MRIKLDRKKKKKTVKTLRIDLCIVFHVSTQYWLDTSYLGSRLGFPLHACIVSGKFNGHIHDKLTHRILVQSFVPCSSVITA